MQICQQYIFIVNEQTKAYKKLFSKESQKFLEKIVDPIEAFSAVKIVEFSQPNTRYLFILYLGRLLFFVLYNSVENCFVQTRLIFICVKLFYHYRNHKKGYTPTFFMALSS